MQPGPSPRSLPPLPGQTRSSSRSSLKTGTPIPTPPFQKPSASALTAPHISLLLNGWTVSGWLVITQVGRSLSIASPADSPRPSAVPRPASSSCSLTCCKGSGELFHRYVLKMEVGSLCSCRTLLTQASDTIKQSNQKSQHSSALTGIAPFGRKLTPPARRPPHPHPQLRQLDACDRCTRQNLPARDVAAHACIARHFGAAAPWT
jgi:hypothetical protein